MRGARLAAAGLVALGAFVAGGWLLQRGMTERQAPVIRVEGSNGTRLFDAVVQTVRSYAVDSLDESTIYRLASSGMLGELSDPYAALVPEADTVRAGEAAGPDPVQGMHLDWDGDYVTVVSVVPHSPAAAAGVRAGDVFLRIGDTTLGSESPEAVRAMIEGRPGSSVRLRVGREGTAPLWLDLTRGPTPSEPPPVVETIGDDLARLRVFRIDDAAAALLRATVDSLGANGGRGLVIDLRGAATGTLAGALAFADALLGAGETIAVTRGRGPGDSTVLRAERGGTNADLAVAVLVDRGTAGPAEVVAGALQDHDRAAVIGEPTFGRGGRLSYYPVGRSLALRLTTEVWLTPSGRTIHRALLAAGAEDSGDSVPPRPEFRTDGGRVVLGGGGIVPDREVPFRLDEGHGEDAALAAARTLLVRAPNRRALIASLSSN